MRVMSQATLMLFAVVTVAGCSSSRLYERVEPGLDAFEPFEMPLSVNEAGVATVTVQTSAGPLELILDTGADHTVLLRSDAAVVDSLKQVGSQWHFRADGKLARTPEYQLDEVQLGPLRYTAVRAPIDRSSFPDFMPGQGMLGRGLLKGLTLDIDVPGGRLGILPAGRLPAGFDEQNWVTVPLLDMSDGPVVPVRLDESERPLRMVLDTGAIATGPEGLYGVVELPRDLSPDEGLVEGYPVYRAQQVWLGQASIGAMNFFVVDHPQPPGTHGFLGNALQQRWRIVIDPSANAVHLLEAD